MFNFPDSVLLARIQFAFTIAFHIIFPAFTIGLANWLAVIEWRWLKTGNVVFEQIYKMWVKIFAICFGMGVVSGVVMSYHFGTNWSVFSSTVGNVIGPLLGYEVLTAFFLEASFLGIMLFGWNKVGPKMHFAATCIVAVGTLISAFWILSANSWMQTPQGFAVDAQGILYPTSWLKIIFNPSFPYRFAHMLTAAFLTTAFVVIATGAYYLKQQKFIAHAKKMMLMGLGLATILAPLQILIGHYHAENTLHYQPIKIAAMEANWERGRDKAFHILALPDYKNEKNSFELSVPYLASLIITGDIHGEVPGLKDVKKADRPPVTLVFYAFRIMVGMGVIMLFTAFMGLFLYWRKKLFTNGLFRIWCILTAPVGFIAVICGWMVTEVGRQPYTVYNVLRTTESISPVAAEQIAFTLLCFVIVYTFIFGAGVFYIFKIIKHGPKLDHKDERFYEHSMENSITKAMHKGEGDD